MKNPLDVGITGCLMELLTVHSVPERVHHPNLEDRAGKRRRREDNEEKKKNGELKNDNRTRNLLS